MPFIVGVYLVQGKSKIFENAVSEALDPIIFGKVLKMSGWQLDVAI